MGALYKGMKKIIYTAIEVLSVIFMIGMVATVCWFVFARYVLNNSPRWGEEVALLCMIWFCLLSSALAIWDDRHIRVTMWDAVLPAKALKVMNIIVHIILLGVIIMLFRHSVVLIELVAPSRMAGTGLSFAVRYAALPVSSVFMLIATIGKVGELIVERD